MKLALGIQLVVTRWTMMVCIWATSDFQIVNKANFHYDLLSTLFYQVQINFWKSEENKDQQIKFIHFIFGCCRYLTLDERISFDKFIQEGHIVGISGCFNRKEKVWKVCDLSEENQWTYNHWKYLSEINKRNQNNFQNAIITKWNTIKTERCL